MPQKFPLNFREAREEVEERVSTPKIKGEGIILAPSFIKDSENYIGIPQYKTLIARRESLHGFDFTNTLEQIKAKDSRFFMPPIAYFMRHFFNVQEATQGKRVLYDGRGNPLPKNETDNLWQYFTSTNRDQFGRENEDKLFWSWLNARFVSGNGFNKLDMQTFNVPNYPALQPLEQCLWRDTYAVIDSGKFNKQGIPMQDIQTQDNYLEGNNIRFGCPRENYVAWVRADSGWAFLYCFGGPSFRDDALGVFVCAEGATRETRR